MPIAQAGIVFRPLDRVWLITDAEGECGQLVPAGSIGTVVVRWASGLAFEVQFTSPIEALATVEPCALQPLDDRTNVTSPRHGERPGPAPEFGGPVATDPQTDTVRE